jgi:hypothetical protein
MAKSVKGGGSSGNDAATEKDPEFEAMLTVHRALKDLPPDAQDRVLEYATRRLSLKRGGLTGDWGASRDDQPPSESANRSQQANRVGESPDEGSEGINPVAQKWMRRNGLSVSALSQLFSIGLDEIDLVARTVPGKQTKEKMRSVLLLKGAAAYLSSGAARVADEALREACVHYGAYDKSNFASYLKSFSNEASGTRESGYTLTALGLTSATEIIKQLTPNNQ